MQSSVTEAAAVASGSALFRGLADPSHLAILLELRKGERRVVDLATMLGLAQATVSGTWPVCVTAAWSPGAQSAASPTTAWPSTSWRRCCAPPSMTEALSLERRRALHRRALWLEYFTVGWNVIEGLVAIGAGLLAGSVALVGFGVDSSIEVISVLGLLWRLRNAGPDATVAEESGATMWPTLAGGRRSAWSSTGSSRRSSSC